MPVLKSKPTKKDIPLGLPITEKIVYEYSIVSVPNYKTVGEEKIIVKEIDSCKLYIDETKNTDIIVKSLTKTIIYTESLIDEKYNELELNKGACVQMTLIRDNWYILSSDGIKVN